MPDVLTQLALALLFPVLGAYVLYWVIRLGVRHGVRDVKEEGRLTPRRSAPA